MSKDGPPISGGYRYGSLNALRASSLRRPKIRAVLSATPTRERGKI